MAASVLGSDNGEEIDDTDDWVLDSLDRYEKLHVFELQQPTQCMEWNQDGRAIFVAGYSAKKHNELLQLLLPEKLLPPNMQTLLARRDFKIGRGAISKQPITHIKSVDLTKSVIATSGQKPELTVWGPDPRSPDLLVATGNLTTSTPTLNDTTELQLSWCSSQPNYLVCGNSTNTLQIIDLTTFQPVWSQCESRERQDRAIHALEHIPGETSQTFLTCTSKGELVLWDARGSENKGSLTFSEVTVSEPRPPGHKFSGDASERHGMATCGSKCVTLSSDGILNIYEIRGKSLQPMACCALKERTQRKSHFGTQLEEHQLINPCVQFSPSSNEVSVSGPMRGVKVYDITSWSNDITNQPKPVFVHDGHEADNPESKVTVHTWHPSFQSMIFSCDSCGIMHAWQWNHQGQS